VDRRVLPLVVQSVRSDAQKPISRTTLFWIWRQG
jgi:hypothetical protein